MVHFEPLIPIDDALEVKWVRMVGFDPTLLAEEADARLASASTSTLSADTIEVFTGNQEEGPTSIASF